MLPPTQLPRGSWLSDSRLPARNRDSPAAMADCTSAMDCSVELTVVNIVLSHSLSENLDKFRGKDLFILAKEAAGPNRNLLDARRRWILRIGNGIPLDKQIDGQ